MTKKEIETIVNNLLVKYQVKGYTFSWMKYRKQFSRAGQCNWKKKTIQLQPSFIEKNSLEIIMQTILHEIAHALTPNHGHNKFWKRKAVEIGCNGRRLYGKEVKR